MIDLPRHEVTQAGAGIFRCKGDFAGSFGAGLRTMMRMIQTAAERDLMVPPNQIHVITDVESIREQVVVCTARLV